MKGKIAVIKSCNWCPYRAVDGTLSVRKELVKEVEYCGYSKTGYDGSQIRIGNSEKYKVPKSCPLPDGDDGREL